MQSNFTHNMLEKMFVKKILTNIQYTNIFSESFDRRWFDNYNYGVIAYLVFKFYKNYQELPPFPIVKALVDKFKDHTKDKEFDYSSCIDTLHDLEKFNLDLTDDIVKTEIKTFVTNKGLFYAISDNIEDIEKFGNVDKCLARFERIQNIEFDTNLGMDYSKDIDKHFDNYIACPEAKISTLWNGIDYYTEGGFLKDGRNLIIVMAQAGLGKSLFLSNLAFNFLKQNLAGVVISLEMSEDVYAQRFDAHISEYNINNLSDNIEENKNKIKRFFAERPGAKLFIKEYPPSQITVSVIENYIDKLVSAGHHIDFIIVDYLNIVKPRSRTDNMYEGSKGISEDLRAMSYKYNVPVITAVQATTEGMNNEDIGMQHIAEGRSIAHTADFIAALYQTGDDQENGIIRMRLLKNRLGGRVGKVLTFKTHPETLVLTDISLTSQDMATESDSSISNTIDLGDL
jgi:replicative DNA helicase